MDDLSTVKRLEIDFETLKFHAEVVVEGSVCKNLVLLVSGDVKSVNVKGHKGRLSVLGDDKSKI